MPVFSLCGDYGIGTLGKGAKEFVDFLKKAGQGYWQILPLSPATAGNSPYSSDSCFAGNPYFIDIDTLISKGLLLKSEAELYDFSDCGQKVCYDKVRQSRKDYFALAFSRFDKNSVEYKSFCSKNAFWLDDYALYKALKSENGVLSRHDFKKEVYFKKEKAVKEESGRLSDKIEYYKFLQFEFFEQWYEIKDYANKNGIKIIGDMPMYVSDDSADVWAHPEQFDLDKSLNPRYVSGVPADAFSAEGQLWGTPVYNWDKMEKDGFSWWKSRIKHNLEIYDTVRIDHFRAFSAFYRVKNGSKNALDGEWVKASGEKLFSLLKAEMGEGLSLVAEDLGMIDGDVRALVKKSGFPNMSVLQFAFQSGFDSTYLPHNLAENSVVYTGTHDNDTVIGWYNSLKNEDREFAEKYLNFTHSEGFNFTLIRAAYMSVCRLAVVPMQDFMGLDSSARINIPGKAEGNWCWRIEGSCLNDWLAKIIKDLAALYFRA